MHPIAIALTLLILAPTSCFAQSAPAQTTSTFEVASVRQNKSGGLQGFASPGIVPNFWGKIVPRPGQIFFTNTPLREIIARAYGILNLDVRYSIDYSHADNAILSTRFDVRAKPPEGAPAEQTLSMLRTLLAERFTLRVHQEERQLGVYVVTMAHEGKLGPQLRPSQYDCEQLLTEYQPIPVDADGRSVCPRLMYEHDQRDRSAETIRYISPISFLLRVTQAFTDRPLVDATGLTGNFAWAVSFSTRPDSAEGTAPAIYTAFEEQLGLKLTKRTGPMDVLVIDTVTMPTSN